MKVDVRLTIEFSDGESRKALAAVLAPDNEGLPVGLKLTGTDGPRSVGYRIESDSPASAISTALALLRDVTLFGEVGLLSRPRRA